MQQGVLWLLCIGLNWQKNLGRKSIVLLERHAAASCVAELSTTVWSTKGKRNASFESQWINSQKCPEYKSYRGIIV